MPCDYQSKYGHIRVTIRLGSNLSPRCVIDREVVICMTNAHYARWPLLIGTKSPVQSSAVLTTHQPQTASLGSFDLSQFCSLAATADLNSPQTGLGPLSKGESKVPRYSHNDDVPKAWPSLCGACVPSDKLTSPLPWLDGQSVGSEERGYNIDYSSTASSTRSLSITTFQPHFIY